MAKIHKPLEWIGKNVVFPPQAGATLGGKPVGPRLLSFQKKFVREILSPEGDIKKSGFIYGCRKVSKSFLFTAIAFYILCSKRKGFEIPVLASTYSQARVLFNQLLSQLNGDRGKDFLIRKDYILHKKSGNKAHVTYNSASANLGLQSSGLIADEVGAYADDSNLQTIQSGLSLSEQRPLMLFSSNPAEDDEHFVLKMFKASQKDPEFYVQKFCLPAGADWRKEASWIDTNPFLKEGKRTKWKRFRNVLLNYRMMFRRAQESQSAELAFRRLQLGESLSAHALDYIPIEKIKTAKSFDFSRKDLRWACGVDLSQTYDFTSMSFVGWKQETDEIFCKNFLYLPTIKNRRPAQKRQFQLWANSGFIQLQNNEVLDPNPVFQDFEKFLKQTGIQLSGIQIDPSLAQHYIEFFEKRCKVGKDRMSGRSMTMSIRELERVGQSGGLNLIGGNPAVKWMFSNVVVSAKSKTYCMLDRPTPQANIDSVVSIALGLKYMLDHPYKKFLIMSG